MYKFIFFSCLFFTLIFNILFNQYKKIYLHKQWILLPFFYNFIFYVMVFLLLYFSIMSLCTIISSFYPFHYLALTPPTKNVQEAGRNNNGKAAHSAWRNYDDFNEYFWLAGLVPYEILACWWTYSNLKLYAVHLGCSLVLTGSHFDWGKSCSLVLNT